MTGAPYSKAYTWIIVVFTVPSHDTWWQKEPAAMALDIYNICMALAYQCMVNLYVFLQKHHFDLVDQITFIYKRRLLNHPYADNKPKYMQT